MLSAYIFMAVLVFLGYVHRRCCGEYRYDTTAYTVESDSKLTRFWKVLPVFAELFRLSASL